MVAGKPIEVPHDWHTRPYQRPLWKALNSGVKRAVDF